MRFIKTIATILILLTYGLAQQNDVFSENLCRTLLSEIPSLKLKNKIIAPTKEKNLSFNVISFELNKIQISTAIFQYPTKNKANHEFRKFAPGTSYFAEMKHLRISDSQKLRNIKDSFGSKAFIWTNEDKNIFGITFTKNNFNIEVWGKSEDEVKTVSMGIHKFL